MKKRVAVRTKKKSSTRVSPEDQAINNIFIEEEPDPTVADQERFADLNLESPKSKTDESYEYVDYGLDEEDSKARWETIAQEKAKEVNEILIDMLATLDAVKSAEEFVNKNFSTKLDIVTSPFLSDIEAMAVAKVKSLLLEGFQFDNMEQKMALFFKYVGKNGAARMVNPVEAMERYLSETEKENNPYGAIGMVRSFDKKK